MLFIFLLLSSLSFATDDASFLDQSMQAENQKARALLQAKPEKKLLPEEIFRRTQLVFNDFQVPAEENYQAELNSISYSTDANIFSQHLKNIDPSGQFLRFFDISPDRIRGFQDRDSKKVDDFLLLTHSAPEKKFGDLRGLRIALDPGHMAGDDWDEITGKYVIQGKVKVSEALIALQTALLIEKQLKAMGAEVLITHRQLGAVSTVPYENLDVKDYARKELRYRSLEDWFQQIISSASEKDLLNQFHQSSAVKKLFSEIMRSEYYTVREDLFARHRLISDFKPDLTVVIHFDAGTREPQTVVPNRTFSYVVGNFPATDFSMSETRAHILAHVAQAKQWQDSVRLSQNILTEISKDLQVPLAKEAPMGLPVAPGVFTRNLVLARQTIHGPLAYLECLYYANQAEFDRMKKTDGGVIQIGDKNYAYPQRLNVLAQAITKGILKFAQNQDPKN
jgi:N-acetylmuramoyl-L-alanine amidase